MDTLNFIDAPVGADAAALPSAPAAEPVTPVQEAAVEPQPAEEPAAPPAQDHAPPQPMVPREALYEARRKIRDLEARLAPTPQPDPMDDPDAFRQGMRADWQRDLTGVKMEMSRALHSQGRGAALVEQAQAWALQRAEVSPAFEYEVINSPDPYGYMIDQYQRDMVASKVNPAEFEQFLAWKAAQSAMPADATPQPKPAPASPPRSISSAPSAGGLDHVPIGPSVAFDAVFDRK